MQKWEYKSIYRTWKKIGDKHEYVWADADEIAHASDSLEKRLEELGRFGWELAGIEPNFILREDTNAISIIGTHYYFKRLLEPASTATDSLDD